VCRRRDDALQTPPVPLSATESKLAEIVEGNESDDDFMHSPLDINVSVGASGASVASGSIRHAGVQASTPSASAAPDTPCLSPSVDGSVVSPAVPVVHVAATGTDEAPHTPAG
jgi:hypothetical protein